MARHEAGERTVRIDLPVLASLYGRAALDAVPSALRPARSTGRLPVRTVVARHPGVTWDQLEGYRRLLGGEVFDGVHRRALPSVMIHTMTFPVQMGLMSSPDFPLPLMGMVHLHNDVAHHQPVNPGTPVQIRARATDMRHHRRGTQFDVVVEVLRDRADVDAPAVGDVLFRGVSTYLSRAAHLADRPSESSGAERRPADPHPGAQTARWRLGRDLGRRYAAISGDYNPIHLSALSARALGMPSAIAHGMYAAARMLEGREPEGAGHRWSIRFAAPMRLPATVAFSAERTVSAEGIVETFCGWDPTTGRRHFDGELRLPGSG